MPVQTFETPVPASAEELFAWHARPGAFQRLCPPWQSIDVEAGAPLENGSRVRLRVRKGPLTFRWLAEHRDVEPGRSFVDVQTEGPFKRWVHQHEFTATQDGALLRDEIDYELPLGFLGRAVAGRSIRQDLTATFGFRHRRTERDLARHAACAEGPRLRIAVTGTHGLVGGDLVPFLTTGGHEVLRLVRGEIKSPGAAPWDPERGLLVPDRIGRLDAIVHLAGESIASGRWTAARKESIRRSRVDSTRRLIRSLGQLASPPSTLVCASAIGFYGDRGDTAIDETHPMGQGFLAETCRAWEDAASEAERLGMRVVHLRFGIILSPGGGALAKMLPAFRLGAGGQLGSGDQYMSWVSIDDAIGAIHHTLVDPRLSGPVNVVAPRAVTNAELTRTLASVLRRPAVLPLPAPAARALFGQMADEMLLASTRVLPTRLSESRFAFFDPELESALRYLLGRAEPE